MADQAPSNGNDAEEWLTPNPEHRDMLLRDVEEWNQRRKENRGITPNLQKAHLRGAKLRTANLGLANLQGADLRGAQLRAANLREANLQDAVLVGADLTGSDLRGAVLTNADLRDAILRWANVYGVRNPPGGFLSNAVHKLGAVCIEDPVEWISWWDDGGRPPAYPEDEIELAEVCGVSVPSDSIES